MTKNDVADIIYGRLWLARTKDGARSIVTRIFRKFTDELVKNGHLRIDGFGEFKVKTRATRRCFNPISKMVETLPEKQIIKFYPSGALKERVQKTDTVSA